jgi:hypothetical protein
LPADGLDDQRSQRQLPDAGVALGAALEAATELAAGRVAHLDDLEDGHRPIELDPAAAQASQLPEAQSSAQEDEDMIPPRQRHAAQQATGFFGREGATPGLPKQLLGRTPLSRQGSSGARQDYAEPRGVVRMAWHARGQLAGAYTGQAPAAVAADGKAAQTKERRAD